MLRSVRTILFHGQNDQSHFGHGIVQCTPTLTSIQVPSESWNSTVHTEFEHLYRIYSIPTHDKHQWLLLQLIVLLMIDAKGVRNM